METTQTQPAQININGKDYDLATLSDTAKSLLVIYNQWQQDREAALKALADAKILVAKNEAALRDLAAEIVSVVEPDYTKDDAR
jgi:hypothetical protein